MNKNKIIWGVVLIVLGLLLLAKNLNILPFTIPRYFFTWKMLLLILGTLSLITGRQIVLSLLLIGISLYFIIPDVFNISPFDIYKVWPVFLIIIGLGVLLKSGKLFDKP